MEPAIRAARPHVIPREPPTSIVPRPPPPDWSLESAPRARRPASVEPWPTSLLTLPSPVYQPLGEPTRAKRERPRRRHALGWSTALLSLTSLALAFWQLYWFFESSESGRALLGRAAGLLASIAPRF